MEIIVAGAILLLNFFPTDNKKPETPTPFKQAVKAAPITQAPTPTDKPVQQTIHKVETGDTLDSISKEYYGSSKYWIALWNDNDFIEDPRIINGGMELKIRSDKPEDTEELTKKLATIYEEVISPSPAPTDTPAPTQEVAGVSVSSAPSQVPAPTGSFEQVYKDAGSKYGVPWEILYGLHHMETGGRDGSITSGYGTGAQGPLQFMPGTWAAYGADGNGDGVSDINNAVDAIHGAANFIARHGGVEQGLKSYGGDSNLVLNYARSRGYSQ